MTSGDDALCAGGLVGWVVGVFSLRPVPMVTETDVVLVKISLLVSLQRGEKLAGSTLSDHRSGLKTSPAAWGGNEILELGIK